MSSSLSYFAIIPAAGVGTRMGANVPKQYLTIHNQFIIDYALAPFIANSQIKKIVVVLHPHDTFWPQSIFAQHPKVITVLGGAERCHSVNNGLAALKQESRVDDWILLHDAVRPCLRESDLEKLMDQLRGHPVGGLLAVPMINTVKKVGQNNEVVATLDRHELWQAYTPQMFRYGLLSSAMEAALAKSISVTDDAAAMELVGHKPMIMAGRHDNIKITEPGDLKLAEFYLSSIVSN